MVLQTVSCLNERAKPSKSCIRPFYSQAYSSLPYDAFGVVGPALPFKLPKNGADISKRGVVGVVLMLHVLYPAWT
jgi:hypothetical protein